MTVRMTETAIQATAKRVADIGKRTDLADATLPGLRLRFTPAGKRTWVLACRDGQGAMRRFPLGEHPAMGVADARDAARTMRASVKLGADPVAERRRTCAVARDARDGIGTVTALLDLYAKHRGHQLKSWAECRRRIDSVFAPHLAKPLGTMQAADLQMTADAHASQQSAAAAVRYLRPVLKWAAQRGYVAATVAILHPSAVVGRRERILDCGELAALLPVLDASTRPYAAALRFMLLTLARREEVCAACWGDISLDACVWVIPVTKNGTAHRVPLSQQAVAMLLAMKADKVKPAALVFATGSGARLGNWDRETKTLQAASKTAGWTRHDLRRTGATMLGEMGTEPHVIEAALNHVEVHSRLAGIYNKSCYQPAVAAALQMLADRLDGIATDAATVVPLRSSRRA